MDPTSVVICDDHAHFRRGLRALLDTSDEIQVVGEAADGAQAVAVAVRLQPDVILMDLTMPGVGGVQATADVLAACPHIGILVLSMVSDDDSVFAALQAGARGYLLKGARKAEIVRAVRAVASGEAIFGADIAARLMGYFGSPAARPNRAQTQLTAAFPQLTARETEILRLIAEQMTNPEVAEMLGLSEKTIRNNVSSIFTKLQVATRAQAIAMARDAEHDQTISPRPAK
jgi:DNA-binding NarL/FixJ family response regulator